MQRSVGLFRNPQGTAAGWAVESQTNGTFVYADLLFAFRAMKFEVSHDELRGGRTNGALAGIAAR